MKGAQIIKLLFLLLTFTVIMDFVPVKTAKKMKNVNLDYGQYVCKYITATDGSWMAEKLYNTNLNNSICMNVEGTDTFNYLSEISNVSSGTPIINMYIFQGEIEKRYISDSVSLNWLQMKKWDIVYPIKRQSIRDIYVPKSYLTIYDFNWFEIMQHILHKVQLGK